MFGFFLSLIVFLFSTGALADTPTPPNNPNPPAQNQTKEMVTLSREDLNQLIEKAAGKKKEGDGPDPDPKDLHRQITDDNKRKIEEQQHQEKIANAAKFNIRLDTFLNEYSGVLPTDANEIPKAATSDKYPNEVDRANVVKAALMQSFFKEEENIKFLSESQLAKWKAYQALGTVGRLEDASSIYEVVFEPAINHARSVRQAKIKSTQDPFAGSTDSEIVFKKMHEKQIRALKANYGLNDVLHAQEKLLGLANAHS